MADLPDISHLTPEERRIIESVMMRQKQEEEQENEIMRRKQDEVQVLEETIRARSEKHKKAGVELSATCHICLKTKFADGIGHICNYCNIRCCARCGGKVTLRSNKVIWVCILCRKKQELLSKTGQWMTKTGLGAADNAMLRRMQEDMQTGVVTGHPEQIQDKRPKLERAHSAAEKENLPLVQRSGSFLRRQYSQQEQLPGRRMSTSDSGVEMPVSPHSRALPTPHVMVGSYSVQQTPRHPAAYPEDDPTLYRGELDGLMRQQAQNYQRQRPVYHDQNSDVTMAYGQEPEDIGTRTGVHPSQQSVHPVQPCAQPMGGQGTLQQQRSFSSSEEERSTPECASDEPDESEKGEKPPTLMAPSRSSRDNVVGERMNRQFHAQTPPWQVSRDRRKLIGHMILRKSPGSGSSSSILGLKVVGGKLLDNGTRGALIEKVKKGSIADLEGQLRPGDEVLKWNDRSLQGKSFCEVSDIIAESRQEPQVKLVVSRNLLSTSTPTMSGGSPAATTTPIASRRTTAQSQWRQKHESMGNLQQPHYKELYDARREKPSVLVTSPGSPDLHAQGRARQTARLPASGNVNVGGQIEVKLGFDHVALQLIVTIVCAAGLTPRSNGHPRDPYAKIFLLPDKSEKWKRRTQTLAKTNDPMWNQTFVYNGIRRSELRQRALEITVWDYGRYGANDFLGEVIIKLATSALNGEPEWHYLTAHEEHRHMGPYQEPTDEMVFTPDCHLSPPSTTSRFSDSDTSECDFTDCDVSREQRRTADGASLSSVGSSSSHYSSPPERDICLDGEHRSRRDMSPQGRKRAALMISREQPASISGYQTHRRDEPHRGMMGHRSHSAAPMDSASLRYRGRSQSPTGHRSLSPPEHRTIPYQHGYVTTRFGSRSATATPTGSPKKRQLPQIPANLHAALKERVAQDLEERARFIKHRNRHGHTTYRSTGMGWERHYSGLSDSDLVSIGQEQFPLPHSYRVHRPRRGHLSPDKDILGDFGDSDMESIASITSSAFSTQSERPRGSRGLIEYASQSSSYEKTPRHQVDDNERNGHAKRSHQFTRSLSNADVPQDEKVDGSLSDTAVGLHVEDASRRGRKSSPGSKSGSGSSSGGGSAIQYQSNLGKKSNSTSQISATGRKRRLGFGKKGKSSFTVHRSEEVLPEDTTGGRSGRQPSSASSDGEGSADGDSLRMASEGGQLSDFIDGLGPGQLVGRQVLGAPSVGDIQLSLSNTKGYLEVEVIRARDLQRKQGSKVFPAAYVKVYLVNGKKCIAKAKTTPASRRTLEPLYQQTLMFRECLKGCILQVTVWGDYGRIEGKKVFMGAAQIMLDDLNLNELVYGWYKLFGTTSL